jgi:acetyl-CoA carboxylase biotin carboxyl carrier protein
MAVQVEAHITGTVFRIEISVGSDVSAGDVLVVIESMKMEMPVEAPRSGRISAIRVQEGQSVEEGDVLVVLE